MLLCATIDGLYTAYLFEMVWYIFIDTRIAQELQRRVKKSRSGLGCLTLTDQSDDGSCSRVRSDRAIHEAARTQWLTTQTTTTRTLAKVGKDGCRK
jgi:hypothetical protein